MDDVHERATFPGPPPDDDDPSDVDSCVLFGEVGAASSFSDVVSFVARSRWRGELVVQIDDVRRSLFFDEGTVIAAATNAPGERIGQVLLRAGLLTAEQVASAVEKHAGESLRFGEAAVALGHITAESLYGAMDLQLEAIFSAVVAETHGSFYFHLGYEESSLSFRRRHRIDTLLVKAFSRIDDPEYFRTRIPSTEHVPARREGREPPERDALGLFEKIDGRRSVADLQKLCADASEVAVMRGIFELVQSGHVSIEPPRVGVGKVVRIYNEAIALLLRELDAMDEGDDVREKLARFAVGDAPSDLFAGAGPADDGTFDAAKIEANIAGIEDAEELVAKWFYDYASYALFLARPHLHRRDGTGSARDLTRISIRVAALLAPLAPRGPLGPRAAGEKTPAYPAPAIVDALEGLDALESRPPTRMTMPVRAETPKMTARMPRVKLPGVDPTRTVRMKPLSDAALANAFPRAAAAAPPPAIRAASPWTTPPALVAGAAIAVLALIALILVLVRSGTENGRTGIVVACEPECDAVHIDGARMERAHGAFDVAAGGHEIVASKAGYRSEVKRVSVSEGESRAVVFVLAPEPKPR